MLGYFLFYVLHAFCYRVVWKAFRFAQAAAEHQRFQQWKEEACNQAVPPPYLVGGPNAPYSARAAQHEYPEKQTGGPGYEEPAPPYSQYPDLDKA